ncbi:MAG: glycosyltransferase [Candidatus Caenarcaniphilales bacterium]|nr:glycosyltransferase [Candidatus Caenarcaniphilales bacterium]
MNANSDEYIRLKRKAFQLLSANEFNRSLFYFDRAAFYASNTQTGIFYDEDFELNLFQLYEKSQSSNDLRQAERINYKIVSRGDSNSSNKQVIGIAVSNILDMGGHTECIIRFCKSLSSYFDIHVFLSESFADSSKLAPEKIQILQEFATIHKFAFCSKRIEKMFLKSEQIVSAIKNLNPSLLMLYVHPEDLIWSLITRILKKENLPISTIFFNHADHIFSLSFDQDYILEYREEGFLISNKFRKKKKTALIPLQGQPNQNNQTVFPKIKEIKNKLFIQDGEILFMSGFSSYKVFVDYQLEFLHFVISLLNTTNSTKYLLISNFSNKEKEVFRKLLLQFDSSLESRVIFLSPQTDFESYIQACDIYIDTFPLGNGLTLIDVIKNGKPVISTKNGKVSYFSSYKNLPTDYQFVANNLVEARQFALELLSNQLLRVKIGEELKKYYLQTFEFNLVGEKYKKFLESIINSENISEHLINENSIKDDLVTDFAYIEDVFQHYLSNYRYSSAENLFRKIFKIFPQDLIHETKYNLKKLL